MKKIIFIVGLLGLTFNSGLCNERKFYDAKHRLDNAKSEVIQMGNIEQTSDSLYFRPQYFNLLYKHIVKNGKIEKVDISSRLDKHEYIEYHVLSYDEWELKVDKSNRIYFTMPQPEYKYYGSILMTNDHVVKIECEDSSDKKKIYKVYNQILEKIEKEY